MIASDVIELAGRRLAAAANGPARIVLFGSHARGDAGPDSDLDFLVIEHDVPDRHAEMVRLEREVRSLGFVFLRGLGLRHLQSGRVVCGG